jgi:hypothetical protein
MFSRKTTLEALQFAKLLEFLDLETTLLNLDFEVDVLFEGGIDLVWGWERHPSRKCTRSLMLKFSFLCK